MASYEQRMAQDAAREIERELSILACDFGNADERLEETLVKQLTDYIHSIRRDIRDIEAELDAMAKLLAGKDEKRLRVLDADRAVRKIRDRLRFLT